MFQKVKNILLFDHDITDEYADRVSKAKVIAWDIETSGLNWQKDKIGICQLYMPEGSVAIIRIDETPPKRLSALLSDPLIRKVFHHAVFDLRFMCHYWKVLPQNIACTKIAAKLLDVHNKNEHSLQPLLRQYLGVTINKNKKVRLSNWLSPKLTEQQISYAIEDVIYLLPLLDTLERELKSKGLLELAHLCFAHIPTRVRLDILGYKDVYSY